MRSRTLSVRGIPLRWLEDGPADGTPVVLVHGIPTSPALWRHVVPRVLSSTPTARLLAFEMLGYGESIPAGRQRPIGVARQADYLLGWLDALGIERAVLVGHDLGGGVAQIAAVRAPRRCAGLVLTNCIAHDNWPVPPVRAMRATSPLVARLPAAAFRALYAATLRHLHSDPAVAAESVQAHLPAYQRSGGGAALARQVRSLDTRDTLAVADDLRRLDVPARVVWGTADPYLRPEHAERLAWDLGTELRRVEGGLHFTPEDSPEPVAAAITEVLAAQG